MRDAYAAPQANQPGDPAAKRVGMHGQRCSVDRTRRRAANHRKWRAAAMTDNARDGAQHTDLVGGSCAAARKHDGGFMVSNDHSLRRFNIATTANTPQSKVHSRYGQFAGACTVAESLAGGRSSVASPPSSRYIGRWGELLR